jgi:hypothetical protein
MKVKNVIDAEIIANNAVYVDNFFIQEECQYITV